MVDVAGDGRVSEVRRPDRRPGPRGAAPPCGLPPGHEIHRPPRGPERPPGMRVPGRPFLGKWRAAGNETGRTGGGERSRPRWDLRRPAREVSISDEEEPQGDQVCALRPGGLAGTDRDMAGSPRLGRTAVGGRGSRRVGPGADGPVRLFGVHGVDPAGDLPDAGVPPVTVSALPAPGTSSDTSRGAGGPQVAIPGALRRCRCGRYSTGAWCDGCWARKVRSIGRRLHAARDRAGLCSTGCWWWDQP